MKVFSRRRTKEATPSSLQGSPTESRPETPRAKQQAPTGPSLLQTQPSRNSPRLAAKSVAPSPVLTPDTNAVPDQGKAGSSARKRRGTEPFQPQEDDASQAASSAAVPRGPAFDNNPAPPFKKAGSLLAQRPASRSSPRRKVHASEEQHGKRSPAHQEQQQQGGSRSQLSPQAAASASMPKACSKPQLVAKMSAADPCTAAGSKSGPARGQTIPSMFAKRQPQAAAAVSSAHAAIDTSHAAHAGAAKPTRAAAAAVSPAPADSPAPSAKPAASPPPPAAGVSQLAAGPATSPRRSPRHASVLDHAYAHVAGMMGHSPDQRRQGLSRMQAAKMDSPLLPPTLQPSSSSSLTPASAAAERAAAPAAIPSPSAGQPQAVSEAVSDSDTDMGPAAVAEAAPRPKRQRLPPPPPPPPLLGTTGSILRPGGGSAVATQAPLTLCLAAGAGHGTACSSGMTHGSMTSAPVEVAAHAAGGASGSGCMPAPAPRSLFVPRPAQTTAPAHVPSVAQGKSRLAAHGSRLAAQALQNSVASAAAGTAMEMPAPETCVGTAPPVLGTGGSMRPPVSAGTAAQGAEVLLASTSQPERTACVQPAADAAASAPHRSREMVVHRPLTHALQPAQQLPQPPMGQPLPHQHHQQQQQLPTHAATTDTSTPTRATHAHSTGQLKGQHQHQQLQLQLQQEVEEEGLILAPPRRTALNLNKAKRAGSAGTLKPPTAPTHTTLAAAASGPTDLPTAAPTNPVTFGSRGRGGSSSSLMDMKGPGMSQPGGSQGQGSQQFKRAGSAGQIGTERGASQPLLFPSSQDMDLETDLHLLPSAVAAAKAGETTIQAGTGTGASSASGQAVPASGLLPAGGSKGDSRQPAAGTGAAGCSAAGGMQTAAAARQASGIHHITGAGMQGAMQPSALMGSNTTGNHGGGGGGVGLGLSRMGSPVGPGRAAQVSAAGGQGAAQTVIEAHEKGEMTQLHDDAIYALDAMAAPGAGSSSSLREPATRLAEMLCSRQGRMALSAGPDFYAQQALSAAARLHVQHDPVLALAASAMLHALAADDAPPRFLTSTAASVLMNQLLQPKPASIQAAEAELDAAAKLQEKLENRAAEKAAKARAEAAKAAAREAKIAAAQDDPFAFVEESQRDASGSGVDNGSDHDIDDYASDAEANVHAGSIDSSIHGVSVSAAALQRLAGDDPCMRRLVKVLLEGPAGRTLGRPGWVRGHLPITLTAIKTATSTSAARHVWSERVKANLGKVGVLERLAKLVQLYRNHLLRLQGNVASSTSIASGTGSGRAGVEPGQIVLWELGLALGVIENATFTAHENEERLLTLQLERPGNEQTAAGAGTSAAAGAVAAAGGSIPGSSRAGCSTESFLQVVVDIVRLLAPHACSSPCAQEAVQAAMCVLMNLTHQHADGVEAVAAAGGLEAVAGLLWSVLGCSPAAAATPKAVAESASGAVQTHGSQGVERDHAVPRCAVQACRRSMLEHLEAVSVCMGLLINMCSASPANQARLRAARLQQQQVLAQVQSTSVSGGAAADPAAAAAGSSHALSHATPDILGDVVPMLCGVLTLFTEQDHEQQQHQGGDGCRDTVTGSGNGRVGCTSLAPVGPAAGAGENGSAAGLKTPALPTGPSGGYQNERDSGARSHRGGGEVGDGSMEVTEGALGSDKQRSEESIVQGYASILLGYLLAWDTHAQDVACTLLPQPASTDAATTGPSHPHAAAITTATASGPRRMAADGTGVPAATPATLLTAADSQQAGWHSAAVDVGSLAASPPIDAPFTLHPNIHPPVAHGDDVFNQLSQLDPNTLWEAPGTALGVGKAALATGAAGQEEGAAGGASAAVAAGMCVAMHDGLGVVPNRACLAELAEGVAATLCFYVQTGAITAHTRDQLSVLAATLKQASCTPAPAAIQHNTQESVSDAALLRRQ